VARFPTETKRPETQPLVQCSSEALSPAINLTIDFHLMQNLGMSESMLPLLPHMLLWYSYEQLY